MILPDTSVWVHQLRGRGTPFDVADDKTLIVTHPFVMGEVALGNLRHRHRVLSAFNEMVQLPVATVTEVATLIERLNLYGTGIGYVAAHLLASVRLVAGTSLWTRDRRLHAQAERLGVAYAP